MTDVHLGFEIGSKADPVRIPIRHMVVAGQTQEAGKTTTLEALIARSGKTAIAFVTKRGEGSFSTGRRIEPYFRERADWQFVASILEATMRERMKFERNWIIRASKGARTLADVHRNVKRELQTARGINEGVYTTLDAYLDLVVPRINEVRWAPALELGAGLNVLDLSDPRTFPPELQGLVMRSVLEAVYLHFQEVITIIPEAWEFIPQGRGSPVKLAAVELIRKGASLKNYVWLDSQDIGGVDKEILRSCPVWLLGVQRERNEIKRVLDNIPDTTAKPKPAAIATLEKGQFFACHGRHAIKTYVQPAWMAGDSARLVATGALDVQQVHAPLSRPAAAAPARDIDKPVRPYEKPRKPQPDPESEDEPMKPDDLQKIIAANNQQLIEQISRALNPGSNPPPTMAKPPAPPNPPAAAGVFDEDTLFERFKKRLLKDPMVLKVLSTLPQLEITEKVVTVQVSTTEAKGMVAKLLEEGFFDTPVGSSKVWNELKRRWNYKGISARAYEQCEWFASNGFMTKEGDGYQAVPGIKTRVVQS